jgi:putative ABC transport system permease protein
MSLRAVQAELRLGWWLARGQRSRFWLLLSCIAVGVAARVCVASFSVEVETSISREARTLLGADLEVASNAPLSPEQQRQLTRLAPAGSRFEQQIGLATMAISPGSGRSHLVEVHGCDAGHPVSGVTTLHGAHGEVLPLAVLFTTTPSAALTRSGMELLSVPIGGTLKLNHLTVTIVAELFEDPGLGSNPFALGPRLVISRGLLPQSDLLGGSSRVRYATLITCPDPRQTEGVCTTIRQAWNIPEHAAQGFAGRVETDNGLLVRTARESQSSISTFFHTLSDFLGLVSLASLLLGGVGVASVVRAAVAERLDSVATIQVLGASPGAVQRLFLGQAVMLGILGGVAGAVAGVVAQNLLIWMLHATLPIHVPMSVDPRAMLVGVGLGVLTASFFAWLPVYQVRSLTPLGIMRGDEPRATRLATLGIIGAGFAVFAVVAAWESGSWKVGPIFVAALAGGAVTLSLWARVSLPLLARLRPRFFALRHGLANLGRPGFHPGAAVVAIGLSALIFGSTLVHQASISAELNPARQGGLPSLFCIDLQSEQLSDFTTLIRSACGSDPSLAPQVHGRLQEIIFADHRPSRKKSQDGHEFRGREQNLSYRAQLGSDEQVVAGRWIEDDATHPEASLERRYAETLGVGLHDHLRFEVQGVMIDAEVTSLRNVEWRGIRPNFFILLSPSALMDAPQSYIASVPTLDAEARSRLQTRISREFPTVSSIDIADVALRIRIIIDRIAQAVEVMGGFTLAAGLVVLMGISLSTARERQLDAALISVLGGRPRTIIISLMTEFAALGAVGSLIGLALAIVVAWLQIDSQLSIPLQVPWEKLAVLWVLITLVCALTGPLGCRRALQASPLSALRDA